MSPVQIVKTIITVVALSIGCSIIAVGAVAEASDSSRTEQIDPISAKLLTLAAVEFAKEDIRKIIGRNRTTAADKAFIACVNNGGPEIHLRNVSIIVQGHNALERSAVLEGYLVGYAMARCGYLVK